MEACICKHCEKKFLSRQKRYVCKDCGEKDEALFRLVEAYLRRYPNSSAVQIADGTGLQASVIYGYMAEGRLLLSRGILKQL